MPEGSAPLQRERAALQLVDQLATPIALLDADGFVRHVNPALADGLRAQRVIGERLGQLAMGSAALEAEADRAIRQASSFIHRDHALGLSGGPSRCDVLLTPIALGRLVLAVEFHAYHDDAGGVAVRNRAMTRALAHELRNPLGGLRGAAQLILRAQISDDVAELAQIVMDEADRLARLTERLLAPSVPQFSATNVHEVIERVLALAAAEFPALQLQRDYDPSLPELQADADRLIQALLNLLRNAAQSGARSVLVKTRAERHLLVGDKVLRLGVRIDVIDDGPGIPDNLRDALFLPLVSGRAHGTGLGLPMALAIAHEHGGTLHCISQPGTTQFSLLLAVR